MLADLSFPMCSAADVSGNEPDRHALIAFKSLITNDPLMALASWNDSSHFCNWTGVACGTSIQKVTSLNLTRLKLAGTIAPHVGNLSFISILDLSGNSFHGGIPSGIENLGRLEILNVSNNLLEGRIPLGLSNCSSLRNLALDHNYLTGTVPPELGSLPQLLRLYLGNNNLTGTIPSSLGNLTSLIEIDMSYNYLNGEVPNSISKLTNLKTFRLSVNYLSGEFPPSLYNLTSLDFIALPFNNLTGNLRNDIGLALPNLKRLWLAYNFFTGPIPDSFPNASKLENIDLIRNNFTGRVPLNLGQLDLLTLSVGLNNLGLGKPDDLDFVSSLTNCSNLRFLHFGDNQFGGVLPLSIANLSTKLSTLYLHSNMIHGSLPKEISNLVSLGTLYMYSNYLNGTIPDSLGMLPNLGKLVLGSNRLTVKIRSSIGNMTSLIWLFLFDNMLEGGIPSSLANCKQLVFIWLAQNNLTGIIPQEVIGIRSILSFNVSYNSLTGPLPENIGNLSNLVEIDLSYNKFSGQISDNLGHCLAMNIIWLQGNLFKGRIPDLANLNSLNYLDLSINNLSGKIPGFLISLSSSSSLNLSFNNLEGEVPSTGVFSNTSAVDIRGNPRLCGGIPELHLPACPLQEPQRIRRKHGLKTPILILIIVLPTSFAALSLLLLLIYCTRTRLQKPPSSVSGSLNFFPKISYKELLNATDGFSSQNLIGSGSFGSVYKGTLRSDGTVVAVKVLNLGQRGASKSFMTECQALRNIRHYNLVKVITACSSNDFHGNDFKALVYQFMTNGSLDKWLHPQEDTLQQHKLNILQRIDIAIDVAAALHYLHHQCLMPVVHCDLKPQNILLDGDMTARVGDFGLARLVPIFGAKETADQFSSLVIKGTIGYAAPEQGIGAQVSILGDVYSFGILLLEIFTGKRPTDNLFSDNLSLHQFVKVSVPHRVGEILDNSALCEEVTGNAETWNAAWSSLRKEQRDCLIRALEIGVACSSESPKDRMSMPQAHCELLMIRGDFLDTRVEKEKKLASISRRSKIEHVEEV
ncbi:hypothetical protein C2S53_005594 [Perilla frutescens var. hirtella]|uniref:non-specific serine/threonine protein kinase n=1 Tax=Perilla frutescens var. hirtella TaxID=608512 RepID=A0AAD4JFP5_PERFH|nr:hypothetical protein C2S53_005594 [Perilla frutescens var. hirtella]